MQDDSDRSVNGEGKSRQLVIKGCEVGARVLDEFSKWAGLICDDKAPAITLASRGLAFGLKIIAKSLRNR
jgi:hypothetical protein